MSDSPPSDLSWDKDTDEINSEDSEILSATRPNRWRGPASSWRTLTEQDVKIAASLDHEQDKDLSIHLYNDYALKKLRPEGWAPPKNWTAWPLDTKTVPRDEFMRFGEGGLLGDEVYSFGQRELFKSSRQWLEEELTASVIRQAKQKFREERDRAKDEDDEGDEGIEGTAGEDDELPLPLGAGNEMDLDPPLSSPPDAGRPATQTVSEHDDGMEAIPSTDDTVSTQLLRPTVDHIVKQLTNTLTVLQNCYVAAAGADTASDSDSGSDSAGSSRSSRHRRKRSKSPFLRSSTAMSTDTETDASRPRSRRGRPKKHVALPGETEEDALIRIARLTHKSLPILPTFSRDSRGRKSNKSQESTDGNDLRGIKHGRSDDDMKEADDSTDNNDESDSGSSKATEEDGESAWSDVASNDGSSTAGEIERRGLRNWKDILAAASLAGIAPQTIQRAAQRCTDIFDESYEIVTVQEGGNIERTTIMSKANTAITSNNTTTTTPPSPQTHKPIPIPAPPLRRSLRSRRAANKPRATTVSEEEEEEPSRGIWSCPIASCPRFNKPTRRRVNLLRHMSTAHGLDETETMGLLGDAEQDGNTHGDGFLRPVRIRQGWRTEDTIERKLRGSRSRSGSGTRSGNRSR